jgi:hypothetical protein
MGFPRDAAELAVEVFGDEDKARVVEFVSAVTRLGSAGFDHLDAAQALLVHHGDDAAAERYLRETRRQG